jgi:hypothetical protein
MTRAEGFLSQKKRQSTGDNWLWCRRQNALGSDSGSGINYVTGATYGPDSALTGFVSGNSPSFTGITNAFTYNRRLQPLTMSATAPSQTVYSIGYDFHAGNGTANSGTDNGNVYGIFNYKDATHGRDQTLPMTR